MKIALNIEWIGKQRGGAEKYAGIIAGDLHSSGHEVHLFTRGVDAGEVPDGVHVHPVKVRQRLGYGWFRAYWFASASERAMRSHDFDLIVGFNKTWYQDVYLALAGAHPAVVRYSLQQFERPWRRLLHRIGNWLSPKQRVFRAIERRQFGPKARPMLVVAPSRFAARHFLELYNLPKDRVLVAYNGIEPRPAALEAEAVALRSEFRTNQGFESGDVAFLFLARNYKLKGLEPLLEAFALTAAKHSNVRLVVCGSREETVYRRQAERLGIINNVRFLGSVEETQHAYLACDAFVLPTFYDTCSLVVPEAMSYGLPVVTTSQNGAAELVESGKDGFVIPTPWHLTHLAESLGRLCHDSVRKEMSAHARRRAELFTMDVRFSELMTILKQCAENVVR